MSSFSDIMFRMGWIGVDLDGTLAHYTGFQGPDVIGEPIPLMMSRVRAWIEAGIEVRIFTARASVPSAIPAVREYLEKHGIGQLAITNKKDFKMIQLWDDRAIQVEINTGKRADGKDWA